MNNNNLLKLYLIVTTCKKPWPVIMKDEHFSLKTAEQHSVSKFLSQVE